MLEQGEIVYRKNLRFADDGKLDLKIGGHPTLNITDGSTGEIYFLLITSSRIPEKARSKRYYKLSKNKEAGLNRNSWVDLSYVFKEEAQNKIPAGEISEKVFNEIMLNFLINLQDDDIEYTKDQLKTIDEFLKLQDYNKMAKAIRKELGNKNQPK